MLGGEIISDQTVHLGVCPGHKYKTFLLKKFFSIVEKKTPHPQKTDLHYMRHKSPSKIISFCSTKMVQYKN